MTDRDENDGGGVDLPPLFRRGAEHPYAPARGEKTEFGSLEQYLEYREENPVEEMAYRWDIHPPTDDDFEEYHPEDPSERAYELEITELDWTGSGNGFVNHQIKVSREDGEAIQKHLRDLWHTARRKWDPIPWRLKGGGYADRECTSSEFRDSLEKASGALELLASGNAEEASEQISAALEGVKGACDFAGAHPSDAEEYPEPSEYFWNASHGSDIYAAQDHQLDSFPSLLDRWGAKANPEYNFPLRWEVASTEERPTDEWDLLIDFALQRKNILTGVVASMSKERDGEDLKEYLTGKWNYFEENWDPIPFQSPGEFGEEVTECDFHGFTGAAYELIKARRDAKNGDGGEASERAREALDGFGEACGLELGE
jgi:hypothetical protein